MTATVAERGRGRNGVGSADAGRLPPPRPARGGRRRTGGAARRPEAARDARAPPLPAEHSSSRHRASWTASGARTHRHRRRTSSRGTSRGSARRSAGTRSRPGAAATWSTSRGTPSTSSGSSASPTRDPSRSSGMTPPAPPHLSPRRSALWRGPALADLADEPALSAVIARLEELRVLALERRVEAELALGRHVDVVSELEGLVEEHPLRERPRGLLMTALYRSGRQAEALGAYRAARALLVGELGIEPSAWLTELHAAILRQDAGLAHPVPERAHAAAREAVAPRYRARVRAARIARRPRGAAHAEPPRELLLMTTVATSGELRAASALANDLRARLGRGRRRGTCRGLHVDRTRRGHGPARARARRRPSPRGRAGRPARGRPGTRAARPGTVRRRRRGRGRASGRRAGPRAVRGCRARLGRRRARRLARPRP